MRVSLDDKYSLDRGKAYMTGVDALVRLPILQHQRDLMRGLNTACFISGYRGSPLGGVDQALWKARQFTEKHNIHFQPGINEDLAMTSVWGSQQVGLFPGAKYDGVFAMWYGKGPGLDRSMDVLKHANAFGTARYGGVLAVAGDDHACKSSTLPHQSDHMFVGATCPVLNPSGVQEILDLGIFGWELSRYSGCWVGMKAITENMDAAISAEIDPGRVNIVIPEDYQLPAGGVHIRWPDNPLDQEERLQRHKIYAAIAFARANRLNRIVMDSPAARLGIIATGKAYLDTLQALDDLGIDKSLAAEIGLRLYKVGMSWPLEPVMTHRFAKGLEEILVIEEKRSVIEDQLTGQLYNWPVDESPRVVGEFDEHRQLLVSNLGELTPAAVARVIAQRIGRFFESEHIHQRLNFLEAKERVLSKPKQRAERSPWYCSGCPHNTSTRVPKGSMAMAGIGCHYMATWMDRETQTFTQMGGEGVTWIGLAPFTENQHIFQNLGDGTYFHSGLLAIRAAVASGVNITYKILYNDAVAMTGGQPVDGNLTVARLVSQLRGEGINRIAVVSDRPENHGDLLKSGQGLTVSHRDDLETIQCELRETSGCTVIVYEQTCAAEKRRRRKKGLLDDPDKRVFINEAVCEGCGDCGNKSNCLSVLPKETRLGRKRMIDQYACNKDYSCVKGFCPSFVTVHGAQLRRLKPTANDGGWEELPQPKPVALDGPFNILLPGVGGTGILTVSAVMGMAAHIAGKGISVLNQTGLAQKFGAVTGHIRIAESQNQLHGVRIPAGEAHLLLGADLVVSAGDEALAKVDSRFSHALINTHTVPTAEFTKDPDAPFHTTQMKRLIAQEVGAGKTEFLNATSLAIGLMGDAIYSNFLMLGCAYQKGLVPLSDVSIVGGIALNGVSVEENQQAFLWGRRYAIDPERVMAQAGVSEALPEEDTFQDIIDFRKEYLREYQDQAYADRYLALVEQCAVMEKSLLHGVGSSYLQLTHAVATNYFKLMAYKDEYEVARLYSNGDFKRALQKQFEGDYTLRFHLAPPFWGKRDPLTGQLIKREFGGWVMGLFRLLARFKWLRGTKMDLFGWSEERRLERQLIMRYEADIARLLKGLREDNLALAIEIAQWPQQVRGFGHVKIASVERVELETAQRMERFLANKAEVKIIELETA